MVPPPPRFAHPNQHIETTIYSCLMGDLLLTRDDDLSRVLTIPEAAAEVGRAPATVRDWIRKEYLTPLRLPGSRRTYTTARAVREAERLAFLNTPPRRKSPAA
jgi:hypothetical protein